MVRRKKNPCLPWLKILLRWTVKVSCQLIAITLQWLKALLRDVSSLIQKLASTLPIKSRFISWWKLKPITTQPQLLRSLVHQPVLVVRFVTKAQLVVVLSQKLAWLVLRCRIWISQATSSHGKFHTVSLSALLPRWISWLKARSVARRLIMNLVVRQLPVTSVLLSRVLRHRVATKCAVTISRLCWLVV